MVIEGAGEMGFSYDKIFRLILLLMLVLSVPVSVSADSDDGVEAELHDFVMPHYRNNKLQFVLFGEQGANLGAVITFTHPLIDIASSSLPDIEFVKLMGNVRVPDFKADTKEGANDDRFCVYPLETPEKDIAGFWAQYPHSDAIILSEKAEYDKNNRLLTGDGKVYFRSRELDIDGVGFDADQKRRFVHIRSEVEVRVHRSEITMESKLRQRLALEVRELELEINKAKNEVLKSKLQEVVEKLKARCVQMIANYGKLSDLKSLKDMKNAFEEQRKTLDSEIKKKSGKLQDLQKQFRKSIEEKKATGKQFKKIGDLTNEIENLLQQKDKLNKEVSKYREKIDALSKEIKERNKAIKDLETDIKALKDDAEKLKKEANK